MKWDTEGVENTETFHKLTRNHNIPRMHKVHV